MVYNNKEDLWKHLSYRGSECETKPYSFCNESVPVSNSSSSKPRRLGYYINVIGLLSKEAKVTKVQLRLIVLELEKLGLDDTHNMDRPRQERLFIQTVKQYVNIPERIIKESLSIC